AVSVAAVVEWGMRIPHFVLGPRLAAEGSSCWTRSLAAVSLAPAVEWGMHIPHFVRAPHARSRHLLDDHEPSRPRLSGVCTYPTSCSGSRHVVLGVPAGRGGPPAGHARRRRSASRRWSSGVCTYPLR